MKNRRKDAYIMALPPQIKIKGMQTSLTLETSTAGGGTSKAANSNCISHRYKYFNNIQEDIPKGITLGDKPSRKRLQQVTSRKKKQQSNSKVNLLIISRTMSGVLINYMPITDKVIFTRLRHVWL